MVYILSSDPVRTIMSARSRQRGSGRRRQRGSGRRRQRGGRRRQRGYGFGDVVKKIAGQVLPYAKKAGKFVIREGLRKAPGLLNSKKKGDFLRNAIKESAKRGMNQIMTEIQNRKPRRKYRRVGRAAVIRKAVI